MVCSSLELPSFTLDGKPIAAFSGFRFLGVLLDYRLDFRSHAEDLIFSCSRRILTDRFLAR